MTDRRRRLGTRGYVTELRDQVEALTDLRPCAQWSTGGRLRLDEIDG